MSDFRQLSESVWASPQITLADVAAAADAGVTMIINNRPEGESPDQVPGPEIAAAAAAAGMAYYAIPVTHAGFSREQVEAMRSVLDGAEGKILAYCRSGTRSTLLWSLAQAAAGNDPQQIADAAHRAGYDVAPVQSLIDGLYAEAKG